MEAAALLAAAVAAVGRAGWETQAAVGDREVAVAATLEVRDEVCRRP